MTHEERDPKRWWVLTAVCLVVLVVVLDNTVLNVAIPAITRDLHATTSDTQWMLNSYSLVMAGLLIAAGGLSDRFGRKNSLIVGLALFGGFSLLAALAAAPTQLILARAGMAVGAAALMPCSLAVLVRVFDDAERPKAIGIWTAVSSGGMVLGPVLGGGLLQYFWWGSVFLINVPVAVVGIIAIATLVSEVKNAQGEPPDLVGALLSVVAMVGVVWGITSGPEEGWGSPVVLVPAAIGLAGAVAFVLWERRTRYPMLSMTLFADRRFRGALTASVLSAFGMGGSLYLLTQHLQFILGYSPLQAGMQIVPMAVALLLFSGVIGSRLIKKIGVAKTVALGMIIISAGLLMIGLSPVGSGEVTVIPSLALVGAGVGLTGPAALSAVMRSIPPERAGVASGLGSTLNETGASLGVAVLGAVVVARFASLLPDGLSPNASKSLPAALGEAAARPDAASVSATAQDAYSTAMSTSQVAGALVILFGGLLAGYLLTKADRAERTAQQQGQTSATAEPGTNSPAS